MSSHGSAFERPTTTARPMARLARPGPVVARMGAASLVVLIALATVLAFDVRKAGLEEASESARRVAAVTARGIVEPRLSAALIAAEPAALAAFDVAMRRYVLRGTLVRVKLMSDTGRVIYSDESRLIGDTYQLDLPQREAVRLHRTHTSVIDPQLPENRYEEPELLEVYVGVQEPGGRMLLFEAYFTDDDTRRAAATAWRRFGPPALGALVLLQLVHLPVAWCLARRHQRDREELTAHVARAATAERRRVAADLHDRVVPTLTGLGYELDASVRGGRSPTQLSTVVTDAAARLRSVVEALRSLLVRLNPPERDPADLPTVLADLAAAARQAGIAATVAVHALGELPGRPAALLIGVAQEAVRNVVGHSGATGIVITAERSGRGAVLTVHDDGVGFDPAEVAGRPENGHMGLRLMAGLLADAGGRLSVSSAPGSGTTLRAEVPLP